MSDQRYIVTGESLDIIEKDGEAYAVPSECYKRQLMEPILTSSYSADQPLWRYISFSELLDILKSKTLPFTRVELLQDASEGSFSEPGDSNIPDELRQSMEPYALAKVAQSFIDQRKNMVRRLNYLTSFYAHENESAVMWERYTNRIEEVVAIQTTLSSLNSLRPDPVKMPDFEFIPRIAVGDVQYVHYLPGAIPKDSSPLLFRSIEHKLDSEVRSIVNLWNLGFTQEDRTDLPSSISVGIDPNSFIRQIVMQPGKALIMQHRLQNMLNQALLTILLRPSGLDKPPMW